MELKDIYELWDRLEQSSVSELELEMQGVHLRLKKGETDAVGVVPVSCQKTVSKAADEAPNAVDAPKSAPEEAARTDNANRSCIKAPLVGTFYLAPAPGETPFVTVGQQVHKGDVVGIIEAMKLVNEITAHEDGIVTAIVAEDGSMVEFDQVLVELMK